MYTDGEAHDVQDRTSDYLGSRAVRFSHFKRSRCHLFPIGDTIVMPADESQATVLGHNQRKRIVDRLTQPVGRTMASADAIGSNPFPLNPFQVVRARHTRNLRQFTHDFNAEPDDFETVAHQDGAVHARQVGNEMSYLE